MKIRPWLYDCPYQQWSHELLKIPLPSWSSAMLITNTGTFPICFFTSHSGLILYISNLPWHTDLFLTQLEVGARSILFRWKLWYETAFSLLLTCFFFHIKLVLDTHLGSASLHTVLQDFSHHFTKSMLLSLVSGRGLWWFTHEVYPVKAQKQQMSTSGPSNLLSSWEWRAEASIKQTTPSNCSGLFPMEDKALWGELNIDSH